MQTAHHQASLLFLRLVLLAHEQSLCRCLADLPTQGSLARLRFPRVCQTRANPGRSGGRTPLGSGLILLLVYAQLVRFRLALTHLEQPPLALS